MSKEDAKQDIENIKSDIRSLMNHLSNLKGDTAGILSDSLDQLTETISNVKDTTKSKLQPNSLVIRALTCLYGDAVQKAVVSFGVTALLVYLFKKDN